ncbi:HAD family hydrolase [Promethearchaeum syntrophicum]|uniref:HAD family hydrolase n=1 Tax=Promethearchaeum syntrophicum TaxID=2594042 RepID=A0A5B9DBT1_9ARCH|nr:HAD family phosphatase [Candidatus Prometheoarchaeum syntrophicum]
MTQIKVIIFDLGGVLINFSFERAYQKWAELTNYEAKIFRSHFAYESEILYQFEKGLITAFEFYEYLTKEMNITWEFEQFKRGWIYTNIGINPKMVTLVGQLRERFKIYALSNINELHAQDIKQRFPQLFSSFESTFFSHELHARKPELEIYQKTLASLNLEPYQVMFIDDLEKNVIEAEKLGVIGIWMQSSIQIKNELKKRGIL